MAEGVEGALPPELSSLTEVVVVRISRTGVKGAIPSAIGNLERLMVLDLSQNELGGAIPKELGKLVRLEKLLLYGNNLVGVIPPALGNLYRLKVLCLQKNRLGGMIPMALGNLQRLEELRLNSNKLEGEIPSELGALPCLRRMDLSRNGLVGMIPHEFRQLKALEMLDVSRNQLSGLWNGTMRFSVEGAGQEEGAVDSMSGEPFRRRVGFPLVFLEKRVPEGRIPAELSELLGWMTELERKASSTSTPALRLLPNPFHEPPEAVAEAGMRSVRAYFADVFADGVVAERHDVKAVILGQTGGGKTSLRRSIESREPRPTNGVRDSTVLTEVARVDIEGTMVSFYDCTGQVEYHGLLQMFITKRAVCLLVFDTTAFGTCDVPSSIKERVDIDIRRLDKLGVFIWLRYLSWRVPGCEVILVGTKCDLLPEKVMKGLPRRIEKACRRWLKRWATFGLKVIVEAGVNLTSCARGAEGRVGGAADEQAPASGSCLRHHAGPGPSGDKGWSAEWSPQLQSPRLHGTSSSRSLLRRITHRFGARSRRGATMAIPRGWDIALAVLEALSVGRDPVRLIESRLKLGKATQVPDGSRLREAAVKGWVTMQKLRAMWLDIVRMLKRCYGVEVRNPLGSLEGALSIREYEGYLLRHDPHVFLDVTWLTEVLKPILHRNEREAPDGTTIVLELGEKTITLSDDRHKEGWRRFKRDGVLRLDLARVLWPENDLHECVLPTLYALGLTFPLAADDDNGEDDDDDDDDGGGGGGLVVLLRLPEDRPESVGEDLGAFRVRHSAVLRAVWSLFLGAPPGAIEKVMARCCGLGRAETYWRFGVLVKGRMRKEDIRGSFALLVEYSYEQMELVVEVFGAENFVAPWVALAHAMSAVQAMFRDFPGMQHKAHLDCPEHRGRFIRVCPEARHPGDSLLDPKSCGHCSRKLGGKGVLAVALLKVTNVNDQSGAERSMYQEISERFEPLAKLYFWSPCEVVGVQTPVELEVFIEALVDQVLGPLEALAKGHASGSTAEHWAEHWAEPLRELEEILQETTKADSACRLEDVRRWSVHVRNSAHQRRRTTQALLEMALEVLECDNGVMTGAEVLARMMRLFRGAERHGAAPVMACILPTADVEVGEGLSRDERRGLRGLRGLELRPDDALQEVANHLEEDDEYGGLSSRLRIFLVCGRTYRLVPWGLRGRGYSLARARTFLGGAAGALRFALRVTSEALIGATSVDTSALSADDRARVARLEKSMARCVTALERGLRRPDDVPEEDSSPGDIGASPSPAPKDLVMEKGASMRLRDFIHEVEDTHRFEACIRIGDTSRASSTPRFVFFEEVMEQAEGHGGRVLWVMKGLDGTRDEGRQCESRREASK